MPVLISRDHGLQPLSPQGALIYRNLPAQPLAHVHRLRSSGETLEARMLCVGSVLVGCFFFFDPCAGLVSGCSDHKGCPPQPKSMPATLGLGFVCIAGTRAQ